MFLGKQQNLALISNLANSNVRILNHKLHFPDIQKKKKHLYLAQGVKHGVYFGILSILQANCLPPGAQVQGLQSHFQTSIAQSI